MRYAALFVLASCLSSAARGDQTYLLRVIENDYLEAKRGNSVVFHSIELLVRPGERFSLKTISGGNTFQLQGMLRHIPDTGFALWIHYASPGGIDKHEMPSNRLTRDRDRPRSRDVRLALNEPIAIRRITLPDDKPEPNVVRLMNVVTVVLTSGKSPSARLLFPDSIEEGMMIDAIQHNSGFLLRNRYNDAQSFEPRSNFIQPLFPRDLFPEPQKNERAEVCRTRSVLACAS
jgi:hypothetical protein